MVGGGPGDAKSVSSIGSASLCGVDRTVRAARRRHVSSEVIAGLFALAGALLGGLISYATTRIDRRWGRAERHIAQLCDQVAAYYQLEQLYKEELARLDPAGRSAKTIMEDMRTRVAQSGEFERPSMTSLAATRLRREWG